jgi:lysophospholipase L1-like esterase
MALTQITSGMTGSALRTALNDCITHVDDYDAKKRWYNKKMVCFGDSIWNQSTVQPELIRLLGTTYNATEMSTGTGGHAPTAYPGSTIMGWSDVANDQSLYKRADDVQYYSPDIIFVCGGTNDNAISPAPTYVYSDAHYTGATFSSVGWAGTPSYISCMKGMLYKLTSQNPSARVIFMGRYNYETTPLTETQMGYLVDRSNADRYCCQWAGVLFIDALTMGIASANASTYMGGLAHPNTAGGILMAEAFAKAASIV